MAPSGSPTQNKHPLNNLVSDTFRAILTVSILGFIVATLFTAATPVGLLSGGFSEKLAEALKSGEVTPTPEWPTPTPRPRPRIGIVAGHSGGEGQIKDPGAVCGPELGSVHEVDVNETVAALVQHSLTEEGYDVDILEEFDPALYGYQALALISIHADTCQFIDNNATGFKVAASVNNPRPEKTARLIACMTNRYQNATGLPIHSSVTADMTYYHAFDEIDDNTPAVIIEVGFLNLDNELLVHHPDRVAQGILDGLLCYLRNEDIPTLVATP
jgi:N-acetylmuramoyl-L-alanine amidase